MVLLSWSGTGAGIYAKLANGMARYNCARVSPNCNSSVLRSLARRQQAQYRQVTHRQGSGRMTDDSDEPQPAASSLRVGDDPPGPSIRSVRLSRVDGA